MPPPPPPPPELVPKGAGRPRKASPAPRQCQAKACTQHRAAYKELQEENKVLMAKLQRRQESFNSDLKGHIRAASIPLNERIHALQREAKCASKESTRTAYYRRERDSAQADVGCMYAELCALRVEVAALTRKEALRTRALEKTQNAYAKQLQVTSDNFDRGIRAARHSATGRVALAEREVVQLAKDAESRATELKAAEAAAEVASDDAAVSAEIAEQAVAGIETALLEAACAEKKRLEATEAQSSAEWATVLAVRREERARAALDRAKDNALPNAPMARSDEDWAALQDGAERKARQRNRDFLKVLFDCRSWSMEDLAWVLAKEEELPVLWRTRELTDMYMGETRVLMRKIETEDFGIEFGLYCHFELHMTQPAILQMTQVTPPRFTPPSPAPSH